MGSSRKMVSSLFWITYYEIRYILRASWLKCQGFWLRNGQRLSWRRVSQVNIDPSWRCLPQPGTKRRGEGILKMEDAGTPEEDDINSQDSNTPIDHGHLVRNCSIKIITPAMKASIISLTWMIYYSYYGSFSPLLTPRFAPPMHAFNLVGSREFESLL